METLIVAHYARFKVVKTGKEGEDHDERTRRFHSLEPVGRNVWGAGASLVVCNACVEKEEIRAGILEMDPEGKNVIHFARGLRNSVAIKWIGVQLWATGMGRDLIGPDKPEDLFQVIEKNGYYGWPYYYQYKQKIYEDEQFKDSSRPAWVTKPPVAFLGFKAHSVTAWL